jgi:hypothetical protein
MLQKNNPHSTFFITLRAFSDLHGADHAWMLELKKKIIFEKIYPLTGSEKLV